LYIGKDAPVFAAGSAPPNAVPAEFSVEGRDGDTVDGILRAASEADFNLIAGRPPAVRGGLMLRGTTAERVLLQAPCPVLAIPIGETAEI
jgi:nucleotide-binding universal stress UspA family protein